jgi:hypothetical protein
MFFSTPQTGGKTADMTTVLTGIVNVAAQSGSLGLVKDHLQQNILRELNTWSQSLPDLHNRFCRTAKETQLVVQSIYETKATVIEGKSFSVVCGLPFPLLENLTDKCWARLLIGCQGPLTFHKSIRSRPHAATSPFVD